MMTPPPQYAPPRLAVPMQPQTAVPPPRFPTGAAPAPAPRTIRGVAPEEKPTPLRLVAADPPPAPLVMPSPEQLGISISASARPAPPAAPFDWADVHRRLERLGITCFQLEKLTPDACRVVCLVPTAQENRQQRIEATGKDQAEAVQRALLRAEEWAAQRR